MLEHFIVPTANIGRSKVSSETKHLQYDMKYDQQTQ